jgi:hypothetical protein
MRFYRCFYEKSESIQMAELQTNQRLSKLEILRVAIPILNRYCIVLKDSKVIHCRMFALELSQALGVSQKSVNKAISYLDGELKSHLVLLYIMQHRSGGPLEKDKPVLAKAYRVKDYDQFDRPARQDAYWTKALKS